MKHITAKVCLVALSVLAVACGDEERFRLSGSAFDESGGELS